MSSLLRVNSILKKTKHSITFSSLFHYSRNVSKHLALIEFICHLIYWYLLSFIKSDTRLICSKKIEFLLIFQEKRACMFACFEHHCSEIWLLLGLSRHHSLVLGKNIGFGTEKLWDGIFKKNLMFCQILGIGSGPKFWASCHTTKIWDKPDPISIEQSEIIISKHGLNKFFHI